MEKNCEAVELGPAQMNSGPGQFKPTAVPPVSGSGRSGARRRPCQTPLPATPRSVWRVTPPHRLDAGYKRTTTPAADSSFSFSFSAANRSLTAAAQRRLAVAPTTHFSIPSGQRTPSSSRCFRPTPCSSSSTPSTPASDHAAAVRHPPVRARLRAAQRR